MFNKEEALVGYWNGSKVTPEIVFTQPEDLTKYKLCVIKLLPLKEEPQSKEIKKVKRELRNLVDSVRRLK
jgi:hypothetical protein